MINTILAAALFALSQGAPNQNTGTGSRCNNYFLGSYSYLYPVGICYQENNDATEVDAVGTTTSWDVQNYMYKCEYDEENRFSNATGSKKVVKYRMGASCEGEIEVETEIYSPYGPVEYACNGVEDQCECEIGGDASECQFYVETDYDWGFSFSGGWYCNKKEYTTTRYVVNMCIQGGSNGQGSSISTYKYACGGWDSRTGVADALFEYNYGDYEGTSADCSSSATAPPTAATTTVAGPQPTSAPTADTGSLYCSESTCDGTDGPRADNANTISYSIAIIAASLSFLYS